MSRYFIDTSVLLDNLSYLDDKDFIISEYTLKDLSELKIKSEHIGQVRKAENYLLNHPHAIVYMEYDVGVYCNLDLAKVWCRSDSEEDVIFATNDIYNYKFAVANNMKVEWASTPEYIEYTGYKEIAMDDETMAYFYEHRNENIYDVLINQYLIIKDANENVVDSYRWNGDMFVPLKSETIKSKMFGVTKPYNNDIYQRCLFDSFANNKITMVHSKAGAGKTVCSLGYLCYLLEKGTIDKIIIFANTSKTRFSEILGYYPGSKDEKILDSSLGNILVSKFGDISQVERMIDEGKLILIPMCDIRGYDTTGMNAGVLITEAQNMDIYLMKLALQRIGEDSICIIDGDYNAQVDNVQYAGNKNGMRRLSEVFRGSDIYGEVMLKNIYRSRIANLAEKM